MLWKFGVCARACICVCDVCMSVFCLCVCQSIQLYLVSFIRRFCQTMGKRSYNMQRMIYIYLPISLHLEVIHLKTKFLDYSRIIKDL